jgi:hypothetical protein
VFLSDFGLQLGGDFAIAVCKERLVKMHVEGRYNIITSLCFVSTSAAASSWVLPMFKSHYHGWGFMYSESWNCHKTKINKNSKETPKIATIAYKFERELQIFTTFRFIFVYFHMLKIAKFG